MAAGTPLSPAKCRGLIEALSSAGGRALAGGTLSPAKCRGLIEASRATRSGSAYRSNFPRRNAGASLKHAVGPRQVRDRTATFPGEMPGPH